MLTYFQTADRILSQLQTSWAALLNPILNQPQSQGVILPNVPLANGATTVNHLLGRKLQGWEVIRKRAKASIWDNQDSNQTPTLTLILQSDAAVVVDLFVF